MKRKFIVLCLLILFIGISINGCTSPTQENPFGIKDPNQVQEWIDYGMTIGKGTVAVGTATGNPYALAWGAGLLAIGGVLTSVLFRRKGNDNNGTT